MRGADVAADLRAPAGGTMSLTTLMLWVAVALALPFALSAGALMIKKYMA